MQIRNRSFALRAMFGLLLDAGRACDGIVVGCCGPLGHSELDEQFLEAFDYSPDRSVWIEAHRDAFDLHDVVRG